MATNNVDGRKGSVKRNRLDITNQTKSVGWNWTDGTKWMEPYGRNRTDETLQMDVDVDRQQHDDHNVAKRSTFTNFVVMVNDDVMAITL